MVGIRIAQGVRKTGTHGARGVEVKLVESSCVTPLALKYLRHCAHFSSHVYPQARTSFDAALATT